MSLYTDTLADFQRFMNAICPAGAYIYPSTETGESLPPQLAQAFSTLGATVIDAGTVAGDFFYTVDLGGTGAEQGTTFVTSIADPLIEQRPGVFVAEQLLPTGAPFDPPRWVAIDTTQRPNPLLET